MLHRLHSRGSAHHDDLAASGPQDLLAGPGEDLLRSAARFVDDDGLLAAHSGHLHPGPGLDLTGHHVRPDSSDLCSSSGGLADH